MRIFLEAVSLLNSAVYSSVVLPIFIAALKACRFDCNFSTALLSIFYILKSAPVCDQVSHKSSLLLSQV